MRLVKAIIWNWLKFAITTLLACVVFFFPRCWLSKIIPGPTRPLAGVITVRGVFKHFLSAISCLSVVYVLTRLGTQTCFWFCKQVFGRSLSTGTFRTMRGRSFQTRLKMCWVWPYSSIGVGGVGAITPNFTVQRCIIRFDTQTCIDSQIGPYGPTAIS